MIASDRDPPPADRRENRRRRILAWARFPVPALLLAIGLAVQFWKPLASPFENDPNFIKTTRPTSSFTSPGDSLWLRLQMKFYEWNRMRHPNPLAYTFSARTSPDRCSIHGLLNQCMEVGGAQYFIEKNVAAGSVLFGSTNVLNGQQWIAAFEDALQNSVPEWWDPETKGFRKENLTLFHYDSQNTLVLSKQGLADTQKRYPNLKW